MYTNLVSHGGNFRQALINEFSTAENVQIASGYTSLNIIQQFRPNFINIASDGGTSKFLIGMAFYEGLGTKKLEELLSLNEELKALNNYSGIYVTNGRRYHGKVYRFYNDRGSNIFVGSSNFSTSGTYGNIECTVPIETEEKKVQIINFLDDLYSEEYSIDIAKAEIKESGKRKSLRKSIENYWVALQKYNPESIDTTTLPKFTYPLERVAEKEKSNLNVYFGKGRLNRKTGIVRPRPWYEIELIAANDLNSQANYPKGDFLAYTDDGLIIPMATQGDYFKNIRSKNSLQIFGIWLKGKLERSGALNRLEPVTLDTLTEYGRTNLTFYKIDDGKYYMEF